MAAKSETATEREVILSRVLAAPRALVWKAWTEPKHLAAWFGPHGFDTRVDMDVRVGGNYRWVMVASDGHQYPIKGSFVEIVAPERLVYTVDLSDHDDAWHDALHPARDKSKPRPAYRHENTVTFEELDANTTRVVLRARFESAAVRDMFVKMGMNEGWGQSFDKLDVLVAGPEREIALTRTFAAPRELVWKLWTEPEHIARWWGPNGFRSTIATMDVRNCGVWELVMHGPDGTDYPNKNIYRDVRKPERISYEHVSDPRHFTTADFVEVDGQTRVTMRMVFATAAERDAVAKKHGAVEGLAQTLGRLGDYLATRS